MAEEEMEGLDGLDDFGDQLDDFMDTGLDEGDAVDGDSQLDSFFEDLSTIDDLEVKDEEPVEEPIEAAEEIIDSPKPEPKPEPEPKKKKPFLMPALMASLLGGVLGAIAVALLVWMNPVEKQPLPPPEPIAPMPVIIEPPPTVVMIEPPPPPPPSPQPPPPPPPPPKNPVKYYVQVANCIYRECVDDYRFLLKQLGYPTTFVTQNEQTPMTEVVSLQAMGEEEAARWVMRINEENQLPGQAYRQSEGPLFRVSLGLFPDLDTAARVKVYLNQLYAKQLIFEAKQASQTIRYSKVRAGGFDSREEATQLQRILVSKDSRFRGAFVVSVTE